LEDQLQTSMLELVIANRILDQENICDAFGHISVRHPMDPDKYIMARSRAPGVIELDDLMEFYLDGTPVDLRDRAIYAERHIHGGVYEARSDVMSVVHSHSHSVIPFGVTDVKLQPVFHMGATVGHDVPVWDIRDTFGDTTLLVSNMEQGRDLAKFLGEKRASLMRGHGAVVVGKTIKEAVLIAVFLEHNARISMQCLQLGKTTFLSSGEVSLCMEQFVGDLAIDRAWDYWTLRTGYQPKG
jgi:ribulose-5-phosphate 4-epimerase/fuculose-1-phosphate aldolase